MNELPAIEVRRCARCQEPAAVCERDWRHSTMGIRTGQSTRDFCCQACGHRFTLAPKTRMWGYAIGSLLMCFTCVVPAIFGGIAARDAWTYQANPVVPGAPVPAIRFRAIEPHRRCATCGGVARCRTVTRRRTNGIPTGTEYGYECAGCGAKFTTASVGSHVVITLAGLLCLVLGAGCLPFGVLVWIVGGVALVGSALQVVAALRNPLIAEPVEG